MEDRIKSLDFYNNKEMFKKHLGEKSYYLSLKKALDKAVVGKTFHFFCDTLPEKGFERRLGQEDMSLDIAEAIRDKEHIMIEGGVGIGKSFAYLVPLLFFNKETQNPVIISTSTISLQEQLIKDLKTLSEIIKAYPQKIIAKGATHFICKKRALEYFEKNSWMNKKYPSLKAWIEGNNGDRAGLSYPIGKEMHLQKLYLLLL